jgi:hypothetical protein
MTRFQKTASVVVLLAMGSAMGWAQILGFGGLVVFDPSNLGEAVTQTGHLVTQINKAIETIKLITQQYEHMKYMAQFLTNQYKYHAASTVWHTLEAPNSTGRLSGWLGAVNRGEGAAGGWADAVVQTVAYSGGLYKVAESQRERKEKDLTTVELMDGTGMSAMDTVGRIRANGPQVEHAMDLLETDTLSDNPDMNTTAARLGTANAIALVNMKSLTDTNKLLVTTAELALVRMKQEHDAATKALLSDSAFRADGDVALRSQHDGASDLMTAFRLP